MAFWAVESEAGLSIVEGRSARAAGELVARDLWERRYSSYRITLAQCRQEVSVRPATDEDLSWSRAMGGRVLQAE